MIVKGILLFSLFPLFVQGSFKAPLDWGNFSGNVLSLTPRNGYLRIRVEFTNRKFLLRGDRVEFYSGGNKKNPCIGRVVGKGFNEVILKVPYMEQCLLRNPFRIGSGLEFQSEDMRLHLESAQEVLEILKKKKMALTSKMNFLKNELNGYTDKVVATNEQFTQRTKEIEREWSKALTSLEEKKLQQINDLKNIELRLFDVDLKMEQYFYKDRNWDIDQWALDQRILKKRTD